MIHIDYLDRRPIYEQVVDKIKELILLGVLEADSQLPSVRSLAVELSINPNTIQRAYAELERQGVIYCVKGRGNFVSAAKSLKEQYRNEIWKKLEELIVEAKKAEIPKTELLEHVEMLY